MSWGQRSKLTSRHNFPMDPRMRKPIICLVKIGLVSRLIDGGISVHRSRVDDDDNCRPRGHQNEVSESRDGRVPCPEAPPVPLV
ncbi:hypothetical protein BofuT4_uP152400.1 [Botrytis cinerea T4]|uniref:Uncharacterized protein n=1 Tax=Botryotinia fuckeliana (strain T4) TaxID=999810 RepID=G2YVN0_BOTF4|nr:hypothetical protein BofuT4_uP152400.1 [Botrytis cinerea T4]